MLNVLTGALVSRLITPTTIVESTPPLRNAPSGTSLTSRRATAAVTSWRTLLARGLAPIDAERLRRRPGTRSCQYRRDSVAPVAVDDDDAVPGSTCATPR